MAPWTRRGTDGPGELGQVVERQQSIVSPVLWMVSAFVIVTAAVVLAFRVLRRDANFLPENNLPIALIAGVVVLVVAVTILLIVAARLGVSDKQSELGLPPGSVRALIALLLIVLFFILAVFLYTDTSRREQTVSRRLTADAIDLLPEGSIVRIESSAGSNSANPTYDVTVQTPKDEDSKDIAKQLITLVGTLVASIASFYFGANSVKNAIESTRRADGTDGGRTAGVTPPVPPLVDPNSGTTVSATEVVVTRERSESDAPAETTEKEADGDETDPFRPAGDE
jgi:hypothetical protein